MSPTSYQTAPPREARLPRSVLQMEDSQLVRLPGALGRILLAERAIFDQARPSQLLDGEGVGLGEDEGVGLGEAASWSTLARAANSWPAVAKSPLPSACW